MKTKLFKSSAILLLSGIVLASSCKDEDRLTVQDTTDISEEAVTDTYYQDTDDMSAVAVQAPSDTEFNGGREKATFTVDDSRFRCGTTPLQVNFERLAGSTPNVPKGKITVDFGTSGCTDNRGNLRKGKIIITFNGRRFIPGSTVVTTFENYSINNVQLAGTRTLKNVSSSTTEAPKFNVVLANGVATFSDGRQATRESNITWQWVRAASPVNDQLVIDQSSVASGVTRNGRSYQVSLLESLVFQRFCGFAVSGVKKYVIDNQKEITIDYGDGTCDRSVTVSVNGVTRNISVN